jgi:hypothetical protein
MSREKSEYQRRRAREWKKFLEQREQRQRETQQREKLLLPILQAIVEQLS